MKKRISTFLFLWVVWIAIAGTNLTEVLLGGVVALITALIIAKHVDYSFGFSMIIGLVKFIVIYIPVFIYKLIIANFDVAYRVLSPKMPINPEFVEVPTDLKSDFGKFLLANSITLTPGTLSLDVKDGHVLVHWINVKGTTEKEYQENVSQPFEKILGGITK